MERNKKSRTAWRKNRLNCNLNQGNSKEVCHTRDGVPKKIKYMPSFCTKICMSLKKAMAGEPSNFSNAWRRLSISTRITSSAEATTRKWSRSMGVWTRSLKRIWGKIKMSSVQYKKKIGEKRQALLFRYRAEAPGNTIVPSDFMDFLFILSIKFNLFSRSLQK